MAKVKRNRLESINTAVDDLVLVGKNVQLNTLTVSDTGGLSGLSGLAIDKLELNPLASDPPTPGDGDVYYNSLLKELLYYDSGRSRFLSVATRTVVASIDGDVGAGTSLYVGMLPTSSNPIYMEEKYCLVAISATTASAENWDIGIADVSGGGSGNNIVVTIDDGLGGSVSEYGASDLSVTFNQGDKVDVYIDSLRTSGTVNRPVVQLIFRKTT